ncbi:hypothetical protein GCM10009799_39210 [Nocardiopsis rhodophaea]|uniref:Uncharacterized protein n=1 Tax=Nocardiopsis rhodophaea TaxID=280238 RepID=A0ABN2TFP7_9ACTN
MYTVRLSEIAAKQASELPDELLEGSLQFLDLVALHLTWVG